MILACVKFTKLASTVTMEINKAYTLLVNKVLNLAYMLHGSKRGACVRAFVGGKVVEVCIK